MSDRYINLSDRQVKDTQNQSQDFMSINTICRRLNQQNQRIAELEEQLKSVTKQVRKEVCEEIRNKLKENGLLYTWKGVPKYKTMEELLDQIQD